MKILYLHQYFRTPEQGGAIRSYYISDALVKEGHEVTMITGHNSPKHKVETVNGITVHYLPVYYENRMSYPGRMWAFLKFMVWAFFISLKIRKVDLCYASSTPLTIGLLALAIKKVKGIPFIFEVRDLWPEAPRQLGILTFKPLIRLALFFEKKTYKNSQLVVTLSPSMMDGIRRKGVNTEIITVPNMADCQFFKKINLPEKTNGKQRQKLDGKFVIAYFGALGKANDLYRLLKLAKKLEHEPFHFLIIGSGSEQKKLEKASGSISNVDFPGYKNKYELREMLDTVDAAYVSFARFPILETNSPNKFFDGLAAGKIILTNTGGWLKNIIEENSCGLYVDEDDPSDIETLKMLAKDESRMEEMSSRSRKLAESTFSKQKLTSELVSVISDQKNSH